MLLGLSLGFLADVGLNASNWPRQPRMLFRAFGAELMSSMVLHPVVLPQLSTTHQLSMHRSATHKPASSAASVL